MFSIIFNKQFQTLNFDPTKSTESKVQSMLRKMKSKFPIQDYKCLYPTSSYPDEFYGTAKLHKIQPNGHVNDLPIRPIVSNIGTATYILKYLAKMFAPLRRSQYFLKCTKNFMDKIKTEKIPNGYHMVSIDVKSLFTIVPLDRTTDITKNI